MTDTVAAAVAALSEPHRPVHVPGPDGPGEGTWLRYDHATTAAALAERRAGMLERYDHDEQVTTAFLAARLLSPLALLGARPVITQGRGLQLDPARLWLRQHPRGWFNAIALEPAATLVTADDPLAGQDGVEVVDGLDEIRHAAVASAVAVAAPVVGRLRDDGRLGERALWGQLADPVVTAAAAPHDATGDAASARDHAHALLACDDRLWVTPDIVRVEVDGAVGLAWRRGSCCLAYRLDRFGYCTGCPLLDRDDWWARSVASVAERAEVR